MIRDVNGVAERVFDFGAATTAPMETYVLGGVTGITFIALFLAYRSKRSPEEYYQGLFEAEQRRYRL